MQTRRKHEIAITAFLLALFVAEVTLFFGVFSGDALIHFVFADNALNGYLFQFNRGEFTGGETSIGYMLFLTLPLALLGKANTIIFVKLLSIAALVSIGPLVYAIARALHVAEFPARVAGLCAMCMPGSVLNGQAGTENGFFAVGILIWLLMAARGRWIGGTHSGLPSEIRMGIGAGLLAWLRPEAVPFFGLVFGYRFVLLYLRSGFGGATQRTLAAGLPFAALLVLYVSFYYFYTGLDPVTAASARLEVSKNAQAAEIFGFWVNYRLPLRFAIYVPLVLHSVLATVTFLRKGEKREETHFALMLLVVFYTFVVLYATVLPSMHVARYTIFLWPLLFVSISVYYAELPSTVVTRPLSLSRSLFGATSLLLLVLIMGVELYLRRESDRGQFYEKIQNIEVSRSDALLRELGNPTKRPISVAVIEVQARIYLDDRFVVRSLDGVVDEAMTKYFCDGFVDHIGYLLERDIDYIGGFGTLNRDASLWSWGHLGLFREGVVRRREGIVFTRIGDYAKVEIDREYYAKNPHVRCDRGPYVLRGDDNRKVWDRQFF